MNVEASAMPVPNPLLLSLVFEENSVGGYLPGNYVEGFPEIGGAVPAEDEEDVACS
jgi:hypothetical protein